MAREASALTRHGAAPRPTTTAISISESPDMRAFGLSEEHLKEAVCEVALHLLADGGDLAYGGDLRPGGFTRVLFELLDRYRRGGDASDTARVTNYLAWPVHIQMDAEALEANISGLKGRARLVLCGLNGEPMSTRSRQDMPPREPDEREWSEGLTAMRRAMLDRTDARVILGGKLDKYKGSMPGIAEEALLSLESERPVFLIGGFGGCARSVAQALGLAGARAGPAQTWPGRDKLKRYGATDLHNGLTFEENRILAESPHIGQSVTLILRGLHRLRRDGLICGGSRGE